MPAKRIIPCLDIKDGRVVKGVNFVNLRDAGDPVEVARRYEEEGADELVFLDIAASHEGRGILLDMIRRVADVCFMPFTVGGGVRTIDDATAILQAGAEKVSVNSAAVENPNLINQLSRRFGACAVVVNIDPKRKEGNRQQAIGTSGDCSSLMPNAYCLVPSQYEVFTRGGRTSTGLDAIAWAKEVAERGAGEIVLTSMDADGTKAGYDIPLTRAVAEAVPIPVVASGGAGSPEHLFRVLTEGKADAALAASIFHDRIHPIPEVKRYLAERGVLVRV